MQFAPKMLQDEEEISQLAELFREQGVTRFLEIGSKFGGSLWRLTRAMPAGSHIVAVDLPGATIAWGDSKVSLLSCIERLNAEGHVARVIWGDSTDINVINEIEGLAPFDAIFIDANHTMSYVEQDWKNYGPLARMVAFHDISWSRPSDWKGTRIDVPQFWDQLKQGRQYVEFRHGKPNNNGIGVIWN